MSESNQIMFEKFAHRYDVFNNIISLGMHKLVKYLFVQQLSIPDDARILDLCSGSGDIARMLKEKSPTAKVMGIDISEPMLDIAKQKVSDAVFINADCTNLPFEDESFDLCTISFGLRNIPDKDRALSEIYRVLKKDGTFAHLDFGKSNNFADKTFDAIVRLLAKIPPGSAIPYNSFLQSKKDFSAPVELIKMFESHGFKFHKKIDPIFGVISGQFCIK